jgi:hypothetical protein
VCVRARARARVFVCVCVCVCASASVRVCELACERACVCMPIGYVAFSSVPTSQAMQIVLALTASLLPVANAFVVLLIVVAICEEEQRASATRAEFNTSIQYRLHALDCNRMRPCIQLAPHCRRRTQSASRRGRIDGCGRNSHRMHTEFARIVWP